MESWNFGGVSTNVKIFHSKRKRKTEIKSCMTNCSADHLMLSEIKQFQQMRPAKELYANLLYKPIMMTVNNIDQVLFNTKHKTVTW